MLGRICPLTFKYHMPDIIMFIAAGVITPSHNLFGYKGKKERKKEGTFLHWFKQLKYASHVGTFSSEERVYYSAFVRMHRCRFDVIPVPLVLPRAYFRKRLAASTDTLVA